MTAPRPKDTFAESLAQAHASLRAGRAATAERWLRTLEARFPGEANCLWLLGAALLDQDKIPESIATLEALLARFPDFANARVDLARAYRRDGRAARAREEVRRVLEKMPHHHLAWLAYGDVLVDLEQYADARVAFERARLDRSPATARRGGNGCPRGRRPEDIRADFSRNPAGRCESRGGVVRSCGTVPRGRQARRCRASAASCPETVRTPSARVARTWAGARGARPPRGGGGGCAPSGQDRA